jgi:hypothetical protein
MNPDIAVLGDAELIIPMRGASEASVVGDRALSIPPQSRTSCARSWKAGRRHSSGGRKSIDTEVACLLFTERAYQYQVPTELIAE